MFQHTAARRRLLFSAIRLVYKYEFQHTAARRRLLPLTSLDKRVKRVSTHSRAEAAAGG